MNNYKIIYFSGTGNTEFLAKELNKSLLKKNFNSELIEFNPVKTSFESNSKLVFMIPVACQTTYPFLWNYFKSLKENKNGVYLISSLAAISGALIEPLRELFREKGFTPLGFKEIIMPSNLRKKTDYEIFTIIENSVREIEDFSDNLCSKESSWNKDSQNETLFESVMNPSLWKNLRSKFALTIEQDKCISCRKCIEVCPTKNITLKNKIYFGVKCESCLKCITNCPTKAIKSNYPGFPDYSTAKYLEKFMLKNKIEMLFNSSKEKYSDEDYKIFSEFKTALNKGEIRSAECVNGIWKSNEWIKKGILLGFRLGEIIEMPMNSTHNFTDKHTYPARIFTIADRVRMVPGGSSVRDGAYIAPKVTMMPPMYVNVGAYVDEGTMVDSHALVGSCAQIGKRVHLSAGAMIGGVLEPINATPVIIEDDAFIGGNTGIYEGVIIKSKAIIAAGVVITSSTPVYDSVNKTWIRKNINGSLIVPENAVVVSGSRPLKSNPEISVYCPVIIKYRDEKSDQSVQLEDYLR